MAKIITGNSMTKRSAAAVGTSCPPPMEQPPPPPPEGAGGAEPVPERETFTVGVELSLDGTDIVALFAPEEDGENVV